MPLSFLVLEDSRGRYPPHVQCACIYGYMCISRFDTSVLQGEFGEIAARVCPTVVADEPPEGTVGGNHGGVEGMWKVCGRYGGSSRLLIVGMVTSTAMTATRAMVHVPGRSSVYMGYRPSCCLANWDLLEFVGLQLCAALKMCVVCCRPIWSGASLRLPVYAFR